MTMSPFEHPASSDLVSLISDKFVRLLQVLAWASPLLLIALFYWLA